jgi:hypothetical protein
MVPQESEISSEMVEEFSQVISGPAWGSLKQVKSVVKWQKMWLGLFRDKHDGLSSKWNQ